MSAVNVNGERKNVQLGPGWAASYAVAVQPSAPGGSVSAEWAASAPAEVPEHVGRPGLRLCFSLVEDRLYVIFQFQVVFDIRRVKILQQCEVQSILSGK